MEDLFACAPYGRANIVVDGRAEIANAFITTGNYYRMLGLTASPGRTIVPDDDRPAATAGGGDQRTVLAVALRERSARVGKVVTFNNVPITIVGVIAPELVGVQQVFRDGPDIAVPMALDAQLNPPTTAPPGTPIVPRLSAPTTWWLQVMGRLKPGVTAAQVQANLGTRVSAHGACRLRRVHGVSARRHAVELALSESHGGAAPRRGLRRSRHLRRQRVGRARGHDSQRRRRAGAADRVRQRGQPAALARGDAAERDFDPAVARRDARAADAPAADRERAARRRSAACWAFSSRSGAGNCSPAGRGRPRPSTGACCRSCWRSPRVTGIAFGIAPALRTTSINVSAALKDTSRSVAGSRSVLTKGLLVLQVAVSLVLLIAAGLFLRTLNNLRHVDVGFNTRNLVLFRVNPSLNRYDDERAATLVDSITARLEAIPGVRAVGVSNGAAAVEQRQLDVASSVRAGRTHRVSPTASTSSRFRPTISRRWRCR